MSLTLPYPDLDFVPLDVLTAEEMNQVVSNYTYISDQFPIGEASLGEAAVKSHNIDWTTITKVPSISSIITNLGTINETREWVATGSGWLTGKAVSLNAGAAYIEIEGALVAGIPYIDTVNNFQCAFCVPVKQGQKVKFTRTGNAIFQRVELRSATY